MQGALSPSEGTWSAGTPDALATRSSRLSWKSETEDRGKAHGLRQLYVVSGRRFSLVAVSVPHTSYSAKIPESFSLSACEITIESKLPLPGEGLTAGNGKLTVTYVLPKESSYHSFVFFLYSFPDYTCNL